MIHLISVLSEHMVFMIKISISKDDCVSSSKRLGHFLASVIILQQIQYNTTNIFMKSKV